MSLRLIVGAIALTGLAKAAFGALPDAGMGVLNGCW
jgi:hypothetical protein